MGNKLWIDHVDVADLVQEFCQIQRTEHPVLDVLETEEIIEDWLTEQTLAIGCADDSLGEFVVNAFEAGWQAAQSGVDHITLCEVIGGDFRVLAGSSEKLVRDLSQYMRSRTAGGNGPGNHN